MLTAFLGPKAPDPHTVTGPTDPGSTRTYDRYSQITHEVIDVRVFRSSDITSTCVASEAARYNLGHLRSIGL